MKLIPALGAALCAAAFFASVTPLAAADLYVGSNSSGVTTNFTSGTNAYTNIYVGYTADASNNTLGVYNAGTLLTNSGNLFVGRAGSGNSLVISNGGTVAVDSVRVIGVDLGSSNNSVLVTGTKSLWTNSGNLFVGGAGSGNSLVISNGGEVAVATDSVIGGFASSSDNTVLVTGERSLWTNGNDLYVGNSGSGNSLVISNGGTVASGNGYIGFDSNSFGNIVLVTGTGSVWTNSGDLYVGYSGTSHRMVIAAPGGKIILIPKSFCFSTIDRVVGLGLCLPSNSKIMEDSPQRAQRTQRGCSAVFLAAAAAVSRAERDRLKQSEAN